MKSFLIAIIAMTSLLAFAQSTRQVRERAALDHLIETTKKLAEADRACRESTDCALLELGDKACGGPSGYTWTSSSNPNFTEVKFLAKKTVEKENAYNGRYQVISDCSLRMPPALECKSRVCVLVSH